MPETDPVEASVQALEGRYRDARPLMMKWAVVTVGLQDLIRHAAKLDLDWPTVARVATRWLELRGNMTREWKTPEQAMGGLSKTLGGNSSRPPPKGVPKALDTFDRRVSLLMQRYGFFLLRISLGIVFFWFGALKPLHLSPADDLVTKTVVWFPPNVFIPILGVWEMAIGLFMLYRPTVRIALALLFLQMPGTALPLLLLPHVCFTHFPYGLTLEGQYIIKNLTLISAAIVVGGTVRHGEKASEQEKVTWYL